MQTPRARSAANPSAAVAAVDRRDRQTDGQTDGQTDARPLHDPAARAATTGNENVPKSMINNVINVFLVLLSAFLEIQTVTVSECCLTTLLPYSLFVKNIFIF